MTDNAGRRHLSTAATARRDSPAADARTCRHRTGTAARCVQPAPPPAQVPPPRGKDWTPWMSALAANA